MDQELWVVVTGNPFDGLTINGIFKDHDAADKWAHNEVSDDYWIVRVEPIA